MGKRGTKFLNKEVIRCQEEMEQDREVRDLEQAGEWVEDAVVRAEVVVARAEVLPQVQVVIASAPTVAQG